MMLISNSRDMLRYGPFSVKYTGSRGGLEVRIINQRKFGGAGGGTWFCTRKYLTALTAALYTCGYGFVSVNFQ